MIDAPLGEALRRYLDLSTQQMRLTAANMANVDTPGYQTVGVNFETEFSKALDATGTARPGEEGEVKGLVARPDGNNVSMDRESVEMAKAQLQFRTGVELLRHQFTRLEEAIKSS